MALINKIIMCPAIKPLLKVNSYSYPNIFRKQSSGEGGTSNLPPCGTKPGDPTMYDVRKYGHALPNNDVCPNFRTLDGIPSGVFRCTTGEVLGLGAVKCGWYPNPEFFSYHHMSWFDLHLHMRKYRQVSPDTHRKPP